VHRITGNLGEEPFRDVRTLAGGVSAPVCIDVGANIGQTIERLRSTLDGPIIHAFEPGPDTFAQLERAMGGTPGVHLNNAALGSEPGTMQLIENTNSDMSSLLEPGLDPFGEVTRRVPVQVETLDRYCAEHGVNRIDLLKSDTQGFDLEVVRGAQDLLAAEAVHMILMEINFNEAYVGLPRLDEIYGFVHDRGFRLVSFYNPHYLPDRLSWADALFVAPAFAR
jgi:FkbM family methyltransferase